MRRCQGGMFRIITQETVSSNKQNGLNLEKWDTYTRRTPTRGYPNGFKLFTPLQLFDYIFCLTTLLLYDIVTVAPEMHSTLSHNLSQYSHSM